MQFQSSSRFLPAERAFSSLEGGAAASRVAALQCMSLTLFDHPGERPDHPGGRPEARSEQDARQGLHEAATPEFAGTRVAFDISEDLEHLDVATLRGEHSPEAWMSDDGFLPGDGLSIIRASSPAAADQDPPSRSLKAVKSGYARVAESPEPESFKRLLEVSLQGPTRLERVASAQMLDSLSQGRHYLAREVLHEALGSHSGEIRSIAELSSAFIASPTLTDLGNPGGSDDGIDGKRGRAAPSLPSPDPLSLTLHGTWARLSKQPWFAPGLPDNLHQHIRTQASTNLYCGADFPRWSGGYQPQDRTRGAEDLVEWVEDHCGTRSVDTIYAHSHGGNVALEALSLGLRAEMLVLLHVPPRSRSAAEWSAIRSHVRRTMVYRVRLDKVVFADMVRTASFGNAIGQRFDPALLPHTDSQPHPITGPWFDHGYYTKPENWAAHRVANDVLYHHP